ncbi:MAG: hypothetical protein V4490_06970, partial [Pseudomonadota bacterium]
MLKAIVNCCHSLCLRQTDGGSARDTEMQDSEQLIDKQTLLQGAVETQVRQFIRMPHENAVQIPNPVHKIAHRDRDDKAASSFQVDDIHGQARHFIIDISFGKKGCVGSGRDGRVKAVRDSNSSSIFAVKIREIDYASGNSILGKSVTDRQAPNVILEAMALHRMDRLVAFGFRRLKHSAKYYIFQTLKEGTHVKKLSPLLFSTTLKEFLYCSLIPIENTPLSIYFYSNFLHSAILYCIQLADKNLIITDPARCNFLVQRSGKIEYVDFSDFYDCTKEAQQNLPIAIKVPWNGVSALTSASIADTYVRHLGEMHLLSLEDQQQLQSILQFFLKIPPLNNGFLQELKSQGKSALSILARVLVRVTNIWIPHEKL